MSRIAPAFALVALLPATACRGTPPAKEPAPSPVARPERQYLGVEACEECHPSAWRAWTATLHARATVVLQTGMAMMVAERVGEPPEHLPENRVCLTCHGVGVYDGRDLDHGHGSRPEEGVTCEACHGPASAHVAAAREGVKGPELVASLWSPTRACLDCHGD